MCGVTTMQADTRGSEAKPGEYCFIARKASTFTGIVRVGGVWQSARLFLFVCLVFFAYILALGNTNVWCLGGG